METLIINGSPRINGDTWSLFNIVKENIAGGCKVLNAYRCNISPCTDCRYCWQNQGCSIEDGMQEIYSYIQSCDNILVASPIYFSELTGKLLDVGSRFQTYYCATHFRNEKAGIKPKKGAVILTGGGDGRMDKAYETACTLLHHINCYNIHELVFTHNTNVRPAVQDTQALMGVQSIIKFFNCE
ncbi:MAG: flavodoxin family protein [Lachnospiraceae bacterium]|nr:flavodoxin family protein [Lachnospiraceae bacterium]